MTPKDLTAATRFSQVMLLGPDTAKEYDGPLTQPDQRLVERLRRSHVGLFSGPAQLVSSHEAAAYGLLLGVRQESSALLTLEALNPSGRMLHFDRHQNAFPRGTLEEAFSYSDTHMQIAEAAASAWKYITAATDSLPEGGKLIVCAHWMLIRMMARGFANGLNLGDLANSLLTVRRRRCELFVWTRDRWMEDLSL